MELSRIFIVGFGSLIGGILRYVVSTVSQKYFGGFPVGTLIVNVVGGFLIGMIMEASASIRPISDDLRTFLTTGIIGGFTTFSTFSYETTCFFTEGEYLIGVLNAGLNLFLALFACWLGKMAVQLV